MQYLRLGNTKKKAIVDDADFYNVNQYKWYLNSRYVVHTFNHNDKVKLHHFIIGRPLPPLVTDHINRNPLDNRRINLRLVNKCVSNQNRRGIGVTWSKKTKKWQVQRERNYKTYYLGQFKTKKEAIQASMIWEISHENNN